MASWLARSTPDRAVWVRALAANIVFCSWARHFTLTVPLSTHNRSSRRRTAEHPRDAKKVCVTELAAHENGCRKRPLEVYGKDGYMMTAVYSAVLGLSFSDF